MKKFLAFCTLIFFVCLASAQNNDLIITTDGDSIACEILEVNDSEIIFNMKYGRSNVQTVQNRDKILEFKYDVVQEGMYHYKSGTSYIIGKYPISSKVYSLDYLQNASNEQLEYYLYKAEKLRKTGKVVSIVGGTTLGAGVYTVVSSRSWGQLSLGFGLVAIGSITTIVGLPILITGSTRVKKINNLERNSRSDFNMNLTPDIQYNQYTQNYQPGVTFSINF